MNVTSRGPGSGVWGPLPDALRCCSGAAELWACPALCHTALMVAVLSDSFGVFICLLWQILVQLLVHPHFRRAWEPGASTNGRVLKDQQTGAGSGGLELPSFASHVACDPRQTPPPRPGEPDARQGPSGWASALAPGVCSGHAGPVPPSPRRRAGPWPSSWWVRLGAGPRSLRKAPGSPRGAAVTVKHT